jgi:predicted ATPase
MAGDISTFLSAVQLLRDKIATFDTFPFSLPAVAGLNTLTFHPAVTFLVGENGSGKSTLLEAIAINLGLNPEGGSRNMKFSTRSSHSSLADYLRLQRTTQKPRDCYFLRAESFYNVASEIERLDQGPGGPPIIGAYGGKSLHEQSHGESFFALFRNRFGGRGLYLLDEPEAALSPMRQMGFLSMMHDLVKAGSQFIIATHAPMIITYPNSWTYVLGGEEIIRTPYQDTEHYRVTREFLNHPGRVLPILLDEDALGSQG